MFKVGFSSGLVNHHTGKTIQLVSSNYGKRISSSSSSTFLITLNSSTQQRFLRAVANTNVIIKKNFNNFVEGEVIKVKAGFMRNFLYPNKIAIYATEANLKAHNETLTPEKKIEIQERKRFLMKQREQMRMNKTDASAEQTTEKEASPSQEL
ncbi:hypothetical protein FDP41_005096 [Naegleria fowleri]|uniref:Ribosomal protein L9 domain-containing protein n=1 Tax=Naegleria fowleri TaxID=5763 RepID=A0A6A5BS83_NAEFO|nr:uncharacterized protein FDP41_005096 [Naegleria fowleri]KAF0975769.1 hypothetical protein FDP41_005096 [Naegleria fowleri]CAG4711453.1 unnamed protein product [Naegleria fowleri]